MVTAKRDHHVMSFQPSAEIAGLTRPLPDEQARLLTLVFDACVKDGGRWPFYAWVEAKLDQAGLDPAVVLGGFPSLRLAGPNRYAAVRADQLMRTPAPNSEVQVTALGVALLAIERHDLVDAVVRPFFEALDCFASKRRQYEPPRHEVGSVNIALPELRDWLAKAGSLVEIPSLLAILEAERPLGLTMHRPSSRGDDWVTGLERSILRFAGVLTIEDYVERRAAELPPPTPAGVPVVGSPLSFPASIDYFNAVWRLAFAVSAGPFRFPSGERAARLGLDVGTAEEFYAAMSAVEDLIKTATLSGVRGSHPCDQLRNKLIEDLPVEVHDEINAAIDLLWSGCQVRHTIQHSGADNQRLKAWSTFGLSYPPPEWSAAWDTIRARLTAAVDTLRSDIATWSESASS